MGEVSQTVRNFLEEFRRNVGPHLNKGLTDAEQLTGAKQFITCYVSIATLMDPQLRELLGIRSGTPEGEFMGVAVVGKPDMTIKTYYKDKNDPSTD